MKTKKRFGIAIIAIFNILLVAGLVSYPIKGYAEPEEKCQWKIDCPDPDVDPNCASCIDNCIYTSCAWMWCDFSIYTCETSSGCWCKDAPIPIPE